MLSSKLMSAQNEEEIRQFVYQALSKFGSVESIHVFGPTSSNSHSVILATMLNGEQAINAASDLGLRIFGYKSLIIPMVNKDDLSQFQLSMFFTTDES